MYRPASIFLLGTPYSKPKLWRRLFTPPASDTDPGLSYMDMNTHAVVSFDFRAPLGIESLEIFEMDVEGLTASGSHVTVRIIPKDSDDGGSVWSYVVTDFSEESLEVTLSFPKSYLNGSWHPVWIDLDESVKKAVDRFEGITEKGDWYMSRAGRIVLTGRMFRLDNIVFRNTSYRNECLGYPDLFEIGPLYAHLDEPYTYIFVADYSGANIKCHVNGETREYDYVPDLMLDPENFLFAQDPNDPNDPVYRYYVNELGADPNLFGENDPNVAEALGLPFFIVDFNLPVFADPNLRFGGSQADNIKTFETLGWNVQVNGYGASGIQAFLLEPLSTVPFDGMPTYLPARHSVIDLIKTYGRPYYSPEQVLMLEAALWNSGIPVWPNVAALNYTPQYFEDMIVTIEVTDGVYSDVRTFPISVVNYPVENYAPVLQLPIEDPTFYIDEEGEYHINFIDPDCFIFSQAYNLNGEIPATTHVPANTPGMTIRDDMSSMVWNLTINNLPSYQYGPWVYDRRIDQSSGLISFIPTHPDVQDAVVTCSDNRGGVAHGEAIITCTYRSFDKDSGEPLTNHPPIIISSPESSISVRAGEEVILSPSDIEVYDPDGNRLFASSNVGELQRISGNDFMWRFQSHFPGLYRVQIVFYDNRGGSVTMTFSVDVKPWWSY
ncbi:MAG: hypothetical protein ACMUIM_00635 [bacterium]